MGISSMDQKLRDQDDKILQLERARRTLYALPGRLSPDGLEVIDWNEATAAGFYWSHVGALNNPTGDIAVGQVLVKADAPNPRIMQVVYFPSTNADELRRTWRRVSTDDGATWSAWTRSGGGTWRGTAARRAATPSVYWDFWQDTDGTQQLYVGNKTGGWRLYSGIDTSPAAAWTLNSTSGSVITVGRTPVFTLPTVLEANEYISATPWGVGSGFGMAAGAGLVRNVSSTQYTMRFTQLGSTTTQALSIIWNIVQS